MQKKSKACKASEPSCRNLEVDIYISIQEVLVQRGVLGPSTCLRGAFAIAVRRCRQGAQNGCSALLWCCQCTQKGCSGCLSLIRCRQGAQNASKRFKNAQKGAKSLKKAPKRLFEPARCRQCARRGCSSLLRCRLCAQRGFSSVLFEIAVRKSWSRLHCALSHCTLHCFAPCMDMHGSTLVYIYLCGG